MCTVCVFSPLPSSQAQSFCVFIFYIQSQVHKYLTLVILPVFSTTVDFKSDGPDVVEVQTFSFDSRGLIKTCNEPFRIRDFNWTKFLKRNTFELNDLLKSRTRMHHQMLRFLPWAPLHLHSWRHFLNVDFDNGVLSSSRVFLTWLDAVQLLCNSVFMHLSSLSCSVHLLFFQNYLITTTKNECLESTQLFSTLSCNICHLSN